MLLPLFAACLVTATASAVSIFTYDFPGGSGAPTSQADYPTASAADFVSDFIRVGVNAAVPINRFNSDGFAVSPTPTAGQYLSFTINGDLGTNISVNRLVLDVGRNVNGPQLLDVVAYLNGVAVASSLGNTVPAAGSASLNFNFANQLLRGDLTGQSVEFRFFGYGGNTTGGNMFVDNVVLHGVVVTSVPEPTTVLGGVAAALAAGGAVLRRRRQA